ncbi:DoxX family protein [Arenibacter sp. GZD96]|uniref:BT_3928 family protein n=1 Tax=Aurantibrevibacter litoralis TaxID=3106030 RepID=UPI002AFEFF2E|nr:BT_3928 family protein [Arenibacter sp. GZD-96]MEA1784662.1 DoxX family protein [Arenibacter sp. GZD-96]
MKYLVGFSRIVVGVLFIISGFIKLNDPVGFSFKLEEYFSTGVLDLPFFMPYALAISLFMVILEVVLGVMLLIGFRVKFTLCSLLLMIVFFTFLTFYSAYFNKVTDCGCFGDAIKLTPWESFTKDVLLLGLIIILFWGQRFITSFLGFKVERMLFLGTLAACIFYGIYVLRHLPVFDFRPYKIGVNIQEGMNTPENAPKPIYEYAWKFNVNGEEKTIVTNGDYPTVDGSYVGVETKEIQKGYEPPIHDFSIEQEGEDFAATLLEEEKLIMVVAYDLRKSNYDAFETVKEVTDAALKKGYKVIGMSASGPEFSSEVVKKYQFGFEFYFTDETTLKTIVRANPGILVVHKGTIVQKLHHNDIDKIELN